MKIWADFGIELNGSFTGEMAATCPKCSHERRKKNVKCLSANGDKQTWICHHCGWSGSLKNGSGKADYAHWQKPQYRKPAPQAKTDLSEKVIRWFADRGISEPVLQRNKIGYGKVYMPQVEGRVNAIRFPYYRGDELVNVKYRDFQKNFRQEAGAEQILYGLADIEETTIACEGETDKLSFEMAGYVNCVSVPNGAPPENAKDYGSKFAYLTADSERIEAVKTWIIATDADGPGQKLAEELARRLGREKCKRLVWPEGIKDANECLTKLGASELQKLIREVQPYPIEGTFSVRDLSDKIDHLYEHGYERGVSTGWHSLNKLYTVRPGELTTLTGIPNSGKSNWIDALTVNLAKNKGWSFAIFSPENQPLEDHMARLIEKWAGQPFDVGPSMRISRDNLEAGKKWADEHFSWILPSNDTNWTLDAILEKARALVFRKGIKGLIIDPWNELEHERPSGTTETEYISKSLSRIRQFARRYSVAVWIVAHPAKLYKGMDGKYPVPTPYDISGSAHWRNKSDNCLTVWRDFGDDEKLVQIHVQKIRFKQVGKIGLCELYYNPVTATYEDRVYADNQKRGNESANRYFDEVLNR